MGASGSFLERKAVQARLPACWPKRFTKACISWAEPSSLPPPLPKMPPISDASAITSVGVHIWGSLPSAWYSDGISDGFGERRADVRVDAGDVVVDVADQLLALGTVELARPVDLLLQVLLGVGASCHWTWSMARLDGEPPMNDDSSRPARCGAGCP